MHEPELYPDPKDVPLNRRSSLIYARPNRFRYLYLIRHGQYRITEEHRDGELTARGRVQARFLAHHLLEIPFARIWCSTMYRAEETARIIAAESFPEIPFQRSRLLREKMFPGTYLYYRIRPELRASHMLLDRLSDRWLRPSRSERHELIVCHGNIIRALVTRAIGCELDAWPRMLPHHCGLTILAARGYHDCRLITFNDHGFLPNDILSH